MSNWPAKLKTLTPSLLMQLNKVFNCFTIRIYDKNHIYHEKINFDIFFMIENRHQILLFVPGQTSCETTLQTSKFYL